MKVILTDGGRQESGFLENKDCSVRATAIALGIQYPEAHAKLKSLGRKDGKGVVFAKIATRLGFEICPEFANRHFEKVLPELTQGKFIVRKAGHVFAVVDGVVFDRSQPKGKARVRMVYRPVTSSLSNPKL